MDSVQLGQAMPALQVSAWLQGDPVDFQNLQGRVVLLEIFQVNCPGCFLYGLPKAIELHQQYADKGLTVIGLATAFEDFELNTLENLRALLSDGTMVGESQRFLNEIGLLQDGSWPLRIPFAVAMDQLEKIEQPLDVESVDGFIQQKLPDIDQFTNREQRQIRLKVLRYLEQQTLRPVTFEQLQLQGTPSFLLIDKTGILRSRHFGDYPQLQDDVLRLLAE